MSRGGVREGSGRKVNPDKGVTRSLVMPIEMWDALDAAIADGEVVSRSDLGRTLFGRWLKRKGYSVTSGGS